MLNFSTSSNDKSLRFLVESTVGDSLVADFAMWPLGFGNAQQLPVALAPGGSLSGVPAPSNPRGTAPTFIIEGTTWPQQGAPPQSVVVIPQASGMVSAPAKVFDDSPGGREQYKRRRSMSEEPDKGRKDKQDARNKKNGGQGRTPTKEEGRKVRPKRLINRATDEEVEGKLPTNPGHKIPALIRDEFCCAVGHYGKGHHNREVDEVWLKQINDSSTITDEKLKV